MACRKMNEDGAYARNTESGCNKKKKQQQTQPAYYTESRIQTLATVFPQSVMRWQCVVPENIHTSPNRTNFWPSTPTRPFWKFQLNFLHFRTFFGLREPYQPPRNSNPFCGVGVGCMWIFSGTVQLYKQTSSHSCFIYQYSYWAW